MIMSETLDKSMQELKQYAKGDSSKVSIEPYQIKQTFHELIGLYDPKTSDLIKDFFGLLTTDSTYVSQYEQEIHDISILNYIKCAYFKQFLRNKELTFDSLSKEDQLAQQTFFKKDQPKLLTNIEKTVVHNLVKVIEKENWTHPLYQRIPSDLTEIAHRALMYVSRDNSFKIKD